MQPPISTSETTSCGFPICRSRLIPEGTWAYPPIRQASGIAGVVQSDFLLGALTPSPVRYLALDGLCPPESRIDETEERRGIPRRRAARGPTGSRQDEYTRRVRHRPGRTLKRRLPGSQISPSPVNQRVTDTRPHPPLLGDRQLWHHVRATSRAEPSGAPQVAVRECCGSRQSRPWAWARRPATDQRCPVRLPTGRPVDGHSADR
jgi:hypothetical protein